MSAVRAKIADGRKAGVLTRDDINDALKEYARRYGDDFSQAAFSPSTAKRAGRPDLVERYYAGREDGRRWPSLNAIKSKHDGSFNKARDAIGLPANSTGPASGRRKAGEAEPILNVRERLVYVSDQKHRDAMRRLKLAEEKLQRALERAHKAEAEVRDLKARPTAAGRPEVKTVVKTETKTVTRKVRDERTLQRMRSQLADERAARRAVQDQLASEQRERLRLSGDLANLNTYNNEARAERDRALDRLAVLERNIDNLHFELERAREQAMGIAEAAVASDLVRRAERRAEQAEVRAAKAERVAAEHGAAVTGQLRQLTSAELDELRTRGPAGPAVMKKALTKLASARAGRGNLRAALNEIARAAKTWEDQL